MVINIKKEALLIKPENIKPTSKDFKVIGTVNPGAARLPNGDIVLYIRVIEKLIKTEDKKYVYSPRYIGKNKFKIKIDRFSKDKITGNSDLDFGFKDDTKRLTFISHLRRIILDKDGFTIKSIAKKPSFFGVSWDGELGVEDPRITKIGDLYVMTYVTLS
jgi:beta-1,2-mannobiose phosphorylase / 1,2-beta-oligomannan phosphorylase